MDNLVLIFQVKGREANAVIDEQSESKWFEKTVKIKAKNQIRDSLEYFDHHKSLPVINERGQIIDIANASGEDFIKIIIYDPASSFLQTKRNEKFVKSIFAGLIHLFHIEDYRVICNYLHTPAELSEYLSFRQEIYEKHKSRIVQLSEQYLIAHFFTTSSTESINESFISNIAKIDLDTSSFDV